MAKHQGSVSKDGSVLAIEADAVKLHPVIDQPIAELLGNLPLQCLQLGIDEFDDLAGFDVDQVVVVRFGRGFIARAAIAEIVPVEDADSSAHLEKALKKQQQEEKARRSYDAIMLEENMKTSKDMAQTYENVEDYEVRMVEWSCR